jgi:hypothetical protein
VLWPSPSIFNSNLLQHLTPAERRCISAVTAQLLKLSAPELFAPPTAPGHGVMLRDTIEQFFVVSGDSCVAAQAVQPSVCVLSVNSRIDLAHQTRDAQAAELCLAATR